MVSGNGANGVTVQQQDPAWSLLDDVLRERSVEYRARVYELVARYKWDVDDPNFLILMATGQMEVLLEKFPEKFEGMFVELLGQLQQQGGELKGWLAQEKDELAEVIRSVEMLQSQIRVTLEERTEQLTAGIEQQQGWVQQQVRDILSISEQERLKMEKALEARVKEMETQLTKRISRDVFKLVERAKPVWVWQTQRDFILVIAAAVLAVFWGGWFISQQFYEARMAEDAQLQLALKIWKWNSETLLDCIEDRQENCTVRVLTPKDKKEK